jgi:hypothetical protein
MHLEMCQDSDLLSVGDCGNIYTYGFGREVNEMRGHRMITLFRT